jgi:hypothetical protein
MRGTQFSLITDCASLNVNSRQIFRHAPEQLPPEALRFHLREELVEDFPLIRPK